MELADGGKCAVCDIEGNHDGIRGRRSQRHVHGGGIAPQPEEIGLKETQSPYLVVADADAVYHKAKATGFDIVRDIRDEGYGGRGFT